MLSSQQYTVLQVPLFTLLDPQVNSCVASILRDMPELMPYKLEVPEDLAWTSQIVQFVPLKINGIVLQSPTAEVHKRNLE